MTDQPFQAPKNQGAAGGTPPDRRANAAELKTAMEETLRLKGSEITTWARARIRSLDTTLAAALHGTELRDLDQLRRAVWKEMLTEVIMARTNALVASLGAKQADSVAKALKALSAAQHGLMLSQVHPLLPDMASYLGGQFAYDTDFWTGVERELAAFMADIAAYVQRMVRVERIVALRMASLDESRTLLRQRLDAATVLRGSVAAQGLEPYVGPLLKPIVLECQAAQQALQSLPDALLNQTGDQLRTAAAATEQAQTQLVTDIIGPPMDLCVAVESRLRVRMSRLTPETLQQLQVVPNLPAESRTAYVKLLDFYQVPWIHCVCALEPKVITRLLERCSRPTGMKALKDKVPTHDTTNLSMALEVLNNPKDEPDVACGKLKQLGFTRIPLPTGVTALSWHGVGPAWAPKAFSASSMETDLACIKHMVQELGPKPTLDKVATYFQDMVKACVTACAQWVKEGRPATFKASPIEVNGAEWHISVRNVADNPQVFHIDSGYEASVWTTR
ncbi:hypothetical protein ABT084_01055 [Streptomyces sp. NPDC002138]|uniref:hypothetical protein n=1 Tax=Streptomyces sp. NPDC002138 TaxID=3154410 RepID=UPI003329CC6A